ncbi:universal stress protein [Microbacterium testaceum]|uniref:UspA domain-containing protein n=1 Tax=Microbacterium testaceum TaxID=2033 RepID=A0A147F9H1_MICTE|nr:universal stress protein [Microbacterium testaceum]KTS13220.1 hypothetical protein RSA3_05540 [Microbacterium testaceum]
MEKIVVGVDGSAASRSALAWVADRCHTQAARVEIVHVIAAHESASAGDAVAEAERELRGAVLGLDLSSRRMMGGVAQALGEASLDADLLVIGVDPGHPVRAALSGWLPIRVIARVASPVCLVPSGWAPRDGGVTVGWQDDLSSSEALIFAAREAQRTSSSLRIVHAWRLPDPTVDGSAALLTRPGRLLNDHRARLEAAVRSVRRRFPTLPIEADLVRADAAAALLPHVPRARAVVVGTHREGVVVGAYVGSVTHDLLRAAECPIFVVPSSSFPRAGA